MLLSQKILNLVPTDNGTDNLAFKIDDNEENNITQNRRLANNNRTWRQNRTPSLQRWQSKICDLRNKKKTFSFIDTGATAAHENQQRHYNFLACGISC
jgi:hypothetical protein